MTVFSMSAHCSMALHSSTVFAKDFCFFPEKTVTAISWALVFPNNVFLFASLKLSKATTVKLDGENDSKGPHFFLFLGQTQLHI